MSTEPQLYLCVDCGGSKTAVVLADRSGEVVGRAVGGPSNFAYEGVVKFVQAVKETVEEALRASSVGPVPLPAPTPLFAAAWLGVSGIDSPANVALAAPVLAKLLSLPPSPPHLTICNDANLLAAPLRFHPDVQHAVTIIGGTGSIAATFKRKGGAEGHKEEFEEMGRTGGWGWILGDEGGGFHVGREALRHILRAHDTALLYGDPSLSSGPLQTRILDIFGVSSPPDFLALVHDPDPVYSAGTAKDVPLHRLISREKRLSQLAPLVFAAAFDDDDPLALDVLRETSAALADQVAMLLRPEGDTSNKSHPPKAVPAQDSVACFGGSLVGVERYRNMVLDALKDMGFVFKHVEYISDAAAVGAKALVSQFEHTV